MKSAKSKLPAEIREWMVTNGRKGGVARARKLTAKKLKEIGELGANARWLNHQKAVKAA